MDADAWRFLETHRVARLATVDAAGRPTVVPICYAGDGTAIYSPLDAKPKRVAPTALARVRHLLATPAVSLVIDDYDDAWTHLAHLIIWGRADLLHPNSPDFTPAIAHLRHRYVQYRTMPIHEQPLIRIVPERSRFWTMPPLAP